MFTSPEKACRMLSFDIETTGLKVSEGAVVTLVCVEEYDTKLRWKYEFAKARVEHRDQPEKVQALLDRLVEHFDEADSLCGFNAIRFDIPFLQEAFKLPKAKADAWKRKTYDILEQCRDLYDHTFSLNLLCKTNSIPVKISSGLEAIKMAKEHRWNELLEYCEADVNILTQLYEKRFLKNPRNGAPMDLKDFAPKNLYDMPWFVDALDDSDSKCESDETSESCASRSRSRSPSLDQVPSFQRESANVLPRQIQVMSMFD